MPGGGGQERQRRGRGSGREESPAGGPGACGGLTASGHLRGPPARPRGALRPAGGQRQGGPGRQASRPPLRSAPLPAGSAPRAAVPGGRLSWFPGSHAREVPPARGEAAAGAGRLQSRTGLPLPRQVWGRGERDAAAAAARRRPAPPPAPTCAAARPFPVAHGRAAGAPRPRAADPLPRALPPSFSSPLALSLPLPSQAAPSRPASA